MSEMLISWHLIGLHTAAKLIHCFRVIFATSMTRFHALGCPFKCFSILFWVPHNRQRCSHFNFFRQHTAAVPPLAKSFIDSHWFCNRTSLKSTYYLIISAFPAACNEICLGYAQYVKMCQSVFLMRYERIATISDAFTLSGWFGWDMTKVIDITLSDTTKATNGYNMWLPLRFFTTYGAFTVVPSVLYTKICDKPSYLPKLCEIVTGGWHRLQYLYARLKSEINCTQTDFVCKITHMYGQNIWTLWHLWIYVTKDKDCENTFVWKNAV